MSPKNPRVSVTIPKAYLRALDALVWKRIYMSRGEAIRAALRLLVKKHEISLEYEGVGGR